MRVKWTVAARMQEHANRLMREEKEKQDMQNAEEKYDDRLNTWEYGNNSNSQPRKDIRTLLITLPTILWANSGCNAINLNDLKDETQVKKQYRKAVRLVHPDRSKQRGDSTERQVYIAYYTLYIVCD